MRFRNSVLALLGVATFAGCDSPGVDGVRLTPDSASLQRVTTVAVALASSSIAVGATTQATAVVRARFGGVINQAVTWQSSNTGVATVSSSGLVSGIGAGSATITGVSGYARGTATVTVTGAAPSSGTTPTVPGTVTNLSAAATSAASVTLSFSAVGDASGAAVSYDVRFAPAPLSWGSAPNVTAGTCATPFIGSAARGTITCTVIGLSPSTTYDFQLVPFSGSWGGTHSYGPLSNVAEATTLAAGSSSPSPVATTVSVSPTSASIAVGASQALVASVNDQSGAVMSCAALSWASQSASIATVNANGVVAGVAVGSSKITAACGAASGSSVITVTASSAPPAPVMTSVVVSPSSVSLNAGATQALSAVVKDQNGTTMAGQSVTWTTSNASVASVSSSGLVTAMTAGSATVTAAAGGKSGTAAVTVLAPAPPPSSGSTNEPAGFTKLIESGFNTVNGDGFTAYGGNGQSPPSATDFTIIQDPTAPKSPSNVAQMRFPKGYGGSASPATIEKGFGAQRGTVYVVYWVKISANWCSHPSGVNKQIYIWSTDGGSTVYTTAQGNGSCTGPMSFEVHDQGTGETKNYGANLVAPVSFTRGDWHKVEVILTANTGGAANGGIDFWVDGQALAHYTNVRFFSGSGVVWNLFQWTPIYGGGSDGNPPADQFQWLDHVYISGK